MKLAFAFAILLGTGLCVSAKPTTFKNSGLKIETVITLAVQGKRVTGTFESSEYGENAVKEAFTGEVVSTPKGKSGVYWRFISPERRRTVRRLRRKPCAGV